MFGVNVDYQEKRNVGILVQEVVLVVDTEKRISGKPFRNVVISSRRNKRDCAYKMIITNSPEHKRKEKKPQWCQRSTALPSEPFPHFVAPTPRVFFLPRIPFSVFHGGLIYQGTVVFFPVGD